MEFEKKEVVVQIEMFGDLAVSLSFASCCFGLIFVGLILSFILVLPGLYTRTVFVTPVHAGFEPSTSYLGVNGLIQLFGSVSVSKSGTGGGKLAHHTHHNRIRRS